MIPISPDPDDTQNYVEMRLDKDTEPEAMSKDLRVDIVSYSGKDIRYVSRSVRHPHPITYVYIPTIAGRFLLVSLNIDAILGEVTIRQRRKKLEEMTQGARLSEAYTATLSRLKAQKGYESVLGLKVLMWVLFSEWPLRADELCYALGVEIGSGKRSCATDTRSILSGACHGRGVFVHCPTGALYPAGTSLARSDPLP